MSTVQYFGGKIVYLKLETIKYKRCVIYVVLFFKINHGGHLKFSEMKRAP